jgi:signal transduction histidine kinase
MEQTNSVAHPDFKIKHGIRKRFSLAMIGLVLVVSVLLAVFQVTSQKQLLEAELEKRVLLMQENLQRRALALVNQLRRLTEDEIASYNLYYLSNELRQLVQNHPDLEVAVLVDRQNKVVLHTSDLSLQQKEYQPPSSKFHQKIELDVSSGNVSVEQVLSSTSVHEDTHWLDYYTPINIGTQQWGDMVLSFSLQQLNDEIRRSQNEIAQSIRNSTLKTFAIVLFVLLVTYLVIAQLSQRLSAPLIRLTQQAQRIADGDFSIGSQLPRGKEDEVGVLSDSFIEMANRLKTSYDTLEEYNLTLEKRVEDRTRELADSQQQLVHSEKMAALGLLIASIAHEINTPLGAIQASSENAEKGYSNFIRNLSTFVDMTSEEDKAFFDLLLKRANAQATLTTREERRVRREMERLLEERGVKWAEELALLFAEMGLRDALPELLPYLEHHDALDLVRNAYQLFSIHAGLSTINSATARASKVVFALKHFSHKESSGEKVATDINHSLDTVLELYRGLFKQGCEVVRNFEDLPLLDCYSDELNQVWTNLIHNALQAMDNRGTLEIATYVERHKGRAAIVVTITDDGPGIPEHLTHRVWESFFTTKAAGEGSGMGLGICKRIVEKHHGQLTFESEPGYTQFKVRLPLLG